jgi:hypothetical protein
VIGWLLVLWGGERKGWEQSEGWGTEEIRFVLFCASARERPGGGVRECGRECGSRDALASASWDASLHACALALGLRARRAGARRACAVGGGGCRGRWRPWSGSGSSGSRDQGSSGGAGGRKLR